MCLWNSNAPIATQWKMTLTLTHWCAEPLGLPTYWQVWSLGFSNYKLQNLLETDICKAIWPSSEKDSIKNSWSFKFLKYSYLLNISQMPIYILFSIVIQILVSDKNGQLSFYQWCTHLGKTIWMKSLVYSITWHFNCFIKQENLIAVFCICMYLYYILYMTCKFRGF